MPVYEYQCEECHKITEVQQKLADQPLTACPECDGPVKKLMSMSSFQLKGGGWYADGYASAKGASTEKTSSTPTPPPCQTGGGCTSCPAAASGK